MEQTETETIAQAETNLFNLSDYRIEKKLLNRGIVIKKDSDNQIRLLMKIGTMQNSSSRDQSLT